MGQTLTREEELFAKGDFARLQMMFTSGGATSHKERKTGFVMSPEEWDALATLCTNPSSEVVATLAATLHTFHRQQQELDTASSSSSSAATPIVLCPALSILVHLIAAFDEVMAQRMAESRCRAIATSYLTAFVNEPIPEGMQEKPPWKELQRSVISHIEIALEAACNGTFTKTGQDVRQQSLMATNYNATELLQPTCSAASARTCANELYRLVRSEELQCRPVLKLILSYVGLYCVFRNGGRPSDAVIAVKFGRSAAECVSEPIVPLCFVDRAFAKTQQLVLRRDFLALTEELAAAAAMQQFNQRQGLLIQESDSLATPATNFIPSWDTLPQIYAGQPAAVAELKELFVARERGLLNTDKPLVLLFFGPSGRGKSELGKILASIRHGTNKPEQDGKLVMLHMTSYCTRDSIYSLVDPPTAHVGEGILLSAVRKNPDAVVLLDEFEKSSADAVQNVWLSAFPKHGMLRSLKQADRSASTTECTFILTCNTCSDLMLSESQAYLEASEEEQETMRARWSAVCRQQLTAKFGEPFTARVDKYVPFVPYSAKEKNAFVRMQLNNVAAQQKKHNRAVLFTESFVRGLVQTVENNFHGDIGGNLLRPHLMALTDRFPKSPITSSKIFEAKSKPVATTSSDSNDDQFPLLLLHSEPTLRGPAQIRRFVGHDELMNSSGVPQEESAALFHVIQLMYMKPKKSTSPVAAVSIAEPKQIVDFPSSEVPSKQKQEPKQEPSMPRKQTSSSSPLPSSSSVPNSPAVRNEETTKGKGVEGAPELELDLEKEELVKKKQTDAELKTQREIDLEAELQLEREKRLAAEKEVVLLKETIKELEKILAILLLMIFSLMFIMSFFVSMSTLVTFAAIAMTTLIYFVKNAPALMMAAIRGLFHLLGPAKFAAVVGCFIAALWFGYQPPPCPKLPVS